MHRATAPQPVRTNESLTLLTWNVAAINNNPFEYWLTYDEDPNYNKLMSAVEEFIESPGDKDVAISQVFTQDMFDELKALMKTQSWNNLDTVEVHWHRYYKDRKIISEFMKDKMIGSKRLTSMPDRVTNTINTLQGPVYRPTVINMYEGKLDSVDAWFTEWKKFMFEHQVALGGAEPKKVCQLLPKIQKAKYPAITEEEEEISVPLQTVLLAVFDAVLVHMLNTVAPDTWMVIKSKLCEKLSKKKMDRTLAILQDTYKTADIMFLQEVSAGFIETASKSNLSKVYHVVSPLDLDQSRDQNSIVLLNRSLFPDPNITEVTATVLEKLKGQKVPIAAGDLLVLTCQDRQSQSYFMASFHGDTNGLATVPILSAVDATANEKPDHVFLFGLDANTYEKGNSTLLGVGPFASEFVKRGLTSCFGDNPDPSNYTTFNARTYLQPQLNKACKSSDKRVGADINPKDFILLRKNQYTVTKVWKDNTGQQEYKEGMVFPTPDFPSDHGIVAAVCTKVATPMTPPTSPTKN